MTYTKSYALEWNLFNLVVIIGDATGVVIPSGFSLFII
jgi:hypothetical protein